MNTYRCVTCEVVQPITDFYRSSSAKRGFQSECKACMRKRNRAWHQSHREQIRDRQRISTQKHRILNPVSLLLRSVKWRAKAQGMVCTLTMDDIVVPEFCPVLGMKLTFGIGLGEGRRNGAANSRASVDRIDNTMGYTPENIVIVSWRANRIKMNATPAELKSVAEFYNDQERIRAAQRQGHQTERLSARGTPDYVPRVFPAPKEEARAVLVGEDR